MKFKTSFLHSLKIYGILFWRSTLFEQGVEWVQIFHFLTRQKISNEYLIVGSILKYYNLLDKWMTAILISALIASIEIRKTVIRTFFIIWTFHLRNIKNNLSLWIKSRFKMKVRTVTQPFVAKCYVPVMFWEFLHCEIYMIKPCPLVYEFVFVLNWR